MLMKKFKREKAQAKVMKEAKNLKMYDDDKKAER